MNIDDSVGRSGVNFSDDVMLVQALFKFAESRLSGKLEIPTSKFPIPSGTFDKETEELLLRFHTFHGGDVKGKVLIIPAKDFLRPGTKELWTIHALENEANEAALLSGKSGDADLRDHIFDAFPNTIFLFRK